MADFTAPSWLFPKEGVWESFVKGAQAGTAIAANRIRAQQAYADIRQGQQKLELAEREQVTRDEAANLHNEVARTKLANDAEDFATMREWWPKFQASNGEIDMPTLHDDNTMLRVAATVADKQSKIGQAEFAKLMSEPGFDLAEPESQKRYFELISRYKNIPAKLGPDGVMAPIKVAENLKRLRDEADSRITAREARTEYNRDVEERRKLLADSTIDVNDVRILDYSNRIAARDRITALKEKVDIGKLEIQKLLADESVDYSDARIQKIQRENAMAEREMAVREGNLALRTKEIGQKGQRLDQRTQTIYNNELKALNSEESGLLKSIETKSTERTKEADSAETARIRKVYNLKRRGLTEKYFNRAEPAAAAPSPAAPSPTGITQEEYDKLKTGDEYTAPDGSRRIKGG